MSLEWTSSPGGSVTSPATGLCSGTTLPFPGVPGFLSRWLPERTASQPCSWQEDRSTGEGECVLPRLPGVPLGGATQPSASCGPLPRAIPAYLEQSLEWAWFILGRVAKVKEGLWLTSAVLLMLPTRDTGKDVWSEGPLTLTDNPHTLRSVKQSCTLGLCAMSTAG